VEEDRWPERMPAGSRGPEWAYRHADRAHGMEVHPHFHTEKHGYPDSVWVYAGQTPGGVRYNAVLIEREATITTAYRVDSIDAGPIRAYLNALGEQGGFIRE
jgi:hypothetical protein